jgi:hypothetical protein
MPAVEIHGSCKLGALAVVAEATLNLPDNT